MLEAAGIISILYIVSILALTIGWFRLKKWDYEDKDPQTRITIVIPARNEAGNIGSLLEDILGQSYPGDLFETLVVNDFSTDDTAGVVEGYRTPRLRSGQVPDAGYRIILVDNDNPGKKGAIRKGVVMATGELIVTVDADCRVGPEWLFAIASYYEKYKPKLISGPVVIKETFGFFKSFQSMELMSLVASGAGSIGIKKPIMCNGANLAFTKEAYLKANENNRDHKYASGDDIFLLLEIKKLYGSNSIRFLKSRDSIVATRAKNTLKGYFNQRFRWVSKSKGYRDPTIIIVALIVFLFNLALLSYSILAYNSFDLARISAVMWIIKVLIDLPILLGFSMFAKRDNIMGYYFVFAIGYVLFTTIAAIVGNLPLGYSWKERKIRN